MRKIELYYAIFIGFIIFSSCSKNDDNKENNDIIIGKWRTIERYESNEPVEILACTSEYYQEFKKDYIASGFGPLKSDFPDPCNLVYIDSAATWKNLGNSNYKFTLNNGIEYISKMYKEGENLVEEYPNGITKIVYELY